MKVWIHHALYQWFSLLVVKWCENIFFVTILDSAYLSTVADHLNPFMVTVNLFYDGCSQQDSLPGVSNHFETPGNDNEVSVLKRPPPDVVEWKILIMHVEKKNCINCVKLSCQYVARCLRNVSSTLLN